MTQFQSAALKLNCPTCGSARINLQMPDYSLHHTAQRCGECDRCFGWQRKPENQQKWQWQRSRIAKLLKSSQLSLWERGFLTSLQGKRSPFPKQQANLAKIESKLGEAQ